MFILVFSMGYVVMAAERILATRYFATYEQESFAKLRALLLVGPVQTSSLTRGHAFWTMQFQWILSLPMYLSFTLQVDGQKKFPQFCVPKAQETFGVIPICTYYQQMLC